MSKKQKKKTHFLDPKQLDETFALKTSFKKLNNAFWPEWKRGISFWLQPNDKE
jgi:hypothetical protein